MPTNIPISEAAIRDQAKEDGITHISTGVAVVRDDKILMVRRAEGDFLGGNFELPGGGVDEGETITEGAIREVKEETGLTVSKIVTTFAGFDYSTDRKPHVRQINFLVEVTPGEVILDPKEHDDFIWVDAQNLKDIKMSTTMRHCVEAALIAVEKDHQKLYLITLEVTPMIVGSTYDPLPSHLTLMSRFWSNHTAEEIEELVKPLFLNTAPIELIFSDTALLGPKRTPVHLINQTKELRNLHMQLLELLNSIDVTYTNQQFIGDNHKPHVSAREDDHFADGHKQIANSAYLIEVEIKGTGQLRKIRTKFDLAS